MSVTPKNRLNAPSPLPGWVVKMILIFLWAVVSFPAILAVSIELLKIGSPGIGLAQICAFLLSFLLVSFLVCVRRSLKNTLLAYSARQLSIRIAALMFSLLIGLTLAELGARMMGYTPAHSGDPRFDNMNLSDWWISDEHGARFNPEARERLRLAPPTGPGASSNWNRLTRINSHGYHDDEFQRDEAQARGILVLGDSFTWGATASPGNSFVEQFEKRLAKHADIPVWNAGIPATGTEQALSSFRFLQPILKARTVILAFCFNDFDDNLYPVDQFFRLRNGKAIRRYRFDLELGEAIRIPELEAYTQAMGFPPADHSVLWQRLIFRSSIGTITYRIFSGLKAHGAEVDLPRKRKWMYQKTEKFILKLMHEIQMGDARILVLLIPSREHLEKKHLGWSYINIRKLLTDNQVDFIDPIDLLDADDYAPRPDTHWNDSGHNKAAKALTAQIIETFNIETTSQ